MDQLLEVAVNVLRLWRICVCAAAGVLIAVILKKIFPSLPAGALVALVFASSSIGIIWNVGVLSAREAASGREQSEVSWPVSFLGIALIGGLWGGLVEAVLGVTSAFVATAVAPWLLGPVFAAIAKKPIRTRLLVFGMLATTLGFATPHAIELLFRLAEA